MIRRFGLPVLILALLVLFSCKKETETYNIDYGYEYFPLDTGHYVIYDVDSILYQWNGNYNNDTARYQLMEKIVDTITDNDNGLSYVLDLYKRKDSTASWSFDRRWRIRRDQSTVRKTEDDLKFTKLIFPPKEGAEWNGNQFLPTTAPYEDFEDWTYNYSDVHKPYTINGHSFDSTVTVNQVDDENLIEKKLRREVYAKNVGMVYQEWEILKKQDVQKDWETGAETGFKIRMKVVAYH